MSLPRRAEESVKVRIPLVVSDQGGPWALGDGLFGDGLFARGHRVGFDDRIVVVIEVEQVGGYSDAHGVAFATVTIHFHSHENLLSVRAVGPMLLGTQCVTTLDPKTRTCYNRGGIRGVTRHLRNAPGYRLADE
jgi:hypothetical protein